MPVSPFSRRRFLGTAVGLSGGLALTACGGGGGSKTQAPAAQQVGQAQIDEAMNKDTQLTFWTWVPKIQNQVDMFEKAYPKVKVKLVNVGQGAPHYTKLRAAIKSGQGAPDVAQMEFQYIDSFTLGGDLADMAPNGAAAVMDQFPDWVKSQVTKDGKVYGIPQDIGPLGLLYRDDLLKGAGITPPKTWTEFATAAQKFKADSPKSVLTNFAPNDAGHFVAYLWQAGARPFSFDGKETVKVDLASDKAKEVAQYWNDDLIKKNLVSVDPDFTDTWYQGFSNGKYASWPAAAWGPVFLQGTAAKTSGKWRATQIPQWDAAKPTSGNWGGSTDAVLKSSANQIAATQLALFINTKASALRLATEQFLFPASNDILADPKFSGQASTFYGGQKVNQTFADISKTVTPDFGWLPFTDFVYTAYGDTLGKAIASKSDLVTGLQAWQDACAKYAKAQGFTVS